MNTFSDPKAVIAQLNLGAGFHIAELGAGSGAYTNILGEYYKNDPHARIFAIDIQKKLLEKIQSDANSLNYSSVRTIWGDIEHHEGTRLRQFSMDMVLVINTLFQIENKKSLIQEAKRILKPEGVLVIVDWSESFGNLGPHVNHVINEIQAKTLCDENGFVLEQDLQAGEHHYGFTARVAQY